MGERLKLSLCYMIRDEERFLEASLNAFVDHVEELIIYDTGSIDRSLMIAEKFQSRVPVFKLKEVQWSDHFSEMRNQIANDATQTWVLFVDGDEVLEQDAYQKISLAIQKREIACYSLIQRNYTWDEKTEGAKPATALPPGLENNLRPLYFFENWMERLYQPQVQAASGMVRLLYEGRIHESLLPTLRRENLKNSKLNVVLHHFGRLKKDQPQKIEYYLELTEKKCFEEPQNPAAWIEWMITLSENGEFQKAFEIAKNSVQRFTTEPEILKTGFQTALRADAYETAEIWLNQYLALKPEDWECKAHLTTALLYQKKFDEVQKVATEILNAHPENFISHINLAVLFFEQKKWNNAERHILSALKHKPHDTFLNEALQKVRQQIQRD